MVVYNVEATVGFVGDSKADLSSPLVQSVVIMDTHRGHKTTSHTTKSYALS